MNELLKYLEQQKTDGDPYQYQFHNPVKKKDIDKLEMHFDGIIPEQLLYFLKLHNGGFICNGHWAEYIWETGNKSLPKDRSICLYSVDEIIEFSNQVQIFADTLRELNYELLKIIPIASTLNGKYVVMKNEIHSAVYSIEYFEKHLIFTEMHPDFKSFLKDYIVNEGYIKELF